MSELYTDQIPVFSVLYVFAIAAFCFAKKKKWHLRRSDVLQRQSQTRALDSKSLIFLSHIYEVYVHLVESS